MGKNALMFKKVWGEGAYNFLIICISSSVGIAGILVILIVPREDNSTESLKTVSLFGASTMLTKSYGPSTAY